MLLKTNLSLIKTVAYLLLMTDLQKTKSSPLIVQHPFTSTGIVAVTRNVIMQPVDITENKENLLGWQAVMKRAIDKAGSAYEIFFMVNKPYGLTFLKFAEAYLSQADFSQILAAAWIRSENPNSDANVSKKELVSMFKRSEPSELMTDEERSIKRIGGKGNNLSRSDLI